MKKISIGNRKIGPGEPCYIIAEVGVNHNGDPDLARQLIESAHSAGADAVKFQTFRADRIVTRHAGKAQYQKRNSDPGESQYEMLKRLELTDETFADLAGFARELGIEFLSSPFDEESVDLLERIGVSTYKVPSGELTNLPLLRCIAATGKPVILSTGMAQQDEIQRAVDLLRCAGSGGIILLHCISIYPAMLSHMNLRTIPALATAFDMPVGLSDHSEGFLAPVIARTLGACIIEKHFTIGRSLSGPDHWFSLDPEKLKDLILKIKLTDDALGDGRRIISPQETEIRNIARKSLVAGCTIPEKTIISEDMIAVKRPGTGISPFEIRLVIGKRARGTIKKDDLIWWDMLE